MREKYKLLLLRSLDAIEAWRESFYVQKELLFPQRSQRQAFKNRVWRMYS